MLTLYIKSEIISVL